MNAADSDATHPDDKVAEALYWLRSASTTLDAIASGRPNPDCAACQMGHDTDGVCRIHAVRYGVLRAITELDVLATLAATPAAGISPRADGRAPGRLAPNRFHEAAWVVGPPENLRVADDAWVGAFCVLDAVHDVLTIGAGSVVASGAHVYTHSTVRRTAIDGRGADMIDHAPTRIGAATSVCANAVVLMGCEVGDRCVVGAGAVVLEGSIVPDDCVVAGNPARLVRRLSPAALARGETMGCRCAFSRRDFRVTTASLAGHAGRLRREAILSVRCREHGGDE